MVLPGAAFGKPERMLFGGNRKSADDADYADEESQHLCNLRHLRINEP
jgi:hypothetical protein